MKVNYSIVRYVPDSFRGEFVNVAILAGTEEGEWAVEQLKNTSRARRLEGGPHLRAVWSYLDSVGGIFDEAEDEQGTGDAPSLDFEWLQSEHVRLNNVVQLSKPAALVADDFESAVSTLHEVFLVDPERVSRRTRTKTVAQLRTAFTRASIPADNLLERVTASVGRQRAHVDFAVANGHLAQLAHAWTFEVADPDKTVDQIKAWILTVRDLRERGGRLVSKKDQVQYEVPTGVDVEVIYTPPPTGTARGALETALEIFDNSEVLAVPADRAGEVAEHARDNLVS